MKGRSNMLLNPWTAEYLLKHTERELKRLSHEYDRAAREYDRLHGTCLSVYGWQCDEASHPLMGIIEKEGQLRKEGNVLRGQAIEIGSRVLIDDYTSPYNEAAGVLKERTEPGAVVALDVRGGEKKELIPWSAIIPYDEKTLRGWVAVRQVAAAIAEAYYTTKPLNDFRGDDKGGRGRRKAGRRVKQ